MKRDAEVLLMLRERARGRTQEQAAARAGMSVRTVRTYERRGQLPSQLKQPRTYRSRPDPFAEDWPWVAAQLERDPALQGQTLFGLLCERQPGHYQAGQLRTLQRHIATWRAQYGSEREVIFPQVHEPGEAAQSDFTHMSSLGVTLGGVPFPHLVYHLVLVYSNVEAVQICFSESFEALVEGFETCLWQVIGGVPRQHRTDHLSAAIAPLDAEGRAQAKRRYQLLMAHYGLEPTTNNLGVAHENGDVEQEHRQFKRAVDQALRARGSREFADRAAYARFLQNLVKQRNLRRQARWLEERDALRPLPSAPLDLCRELRATVSRFSTIQVLRNTYSVPSRLIGTTLLVRVRSETLQVYRGTTPLLTMPRLLGTGQHRIDYRHVIWSLVRKPGAFAHYRYRDDLFPSLVFRRAYDALRAHVPERADRHYVRLLHLAASTAESEVELALGLLLEQRLVPTFDAVRDLVRTPAAQRVPELSTPVLDLSAYDRLLGLGAGRG
ncbi:MAG: IS21 family transposase [Sinobacteraceae bacterium]|nr:IS21 family transposase [Nevskiaceae bacterium]